MDHSDREKPESAADSFFIQNDFDRSLIEMVKASTPRGQYSARSAIRHIDKAAVIAEADPEMAAFRAITAEEESATAIFHALQLVKYPGSEFLKPHDHVQKNAVRPFCLAISDVMAIADKQFPLQPELYVNRSGPLPLLGTRMQLGGRYVMPNPPLNMAIGRGETRHVMHQDDFSKELQQLASDQNTATILAYIKTRANLRNQILYASATGLPSIQLNNFLIEQRNIVRINVSMFLLVDQYPEQQLFVKQALRAFLKMLKCLPKDMLFADEQ